MENSLDHAKESKRIVYLDIMRGLAVLFMVMQHGILIFEFSSGNDTGILGSIFVLLGTAPAAPIFMLVMGVFMMQSEADDWTFVKRGFKLLCAGYVLNFIRFTIPFFLDGDLAGGIEMLFYVDIFQLAGLFFITTVLFRKLANHRYLPPIIITTILCVSPFLWGITPEHPMTDLLWGMGETVSFPFFPWCVYPLLGMYLSQYICHISIEKQYRKSILMAAVLLSIAGFFLLDLYPFWNYERLGLGASMMMIAFILIYIVVAERVVHKYNLTTKQKAIRLLTFWSVHLTNIYWISWTLFAVVAVFIGVNGYNDMTSTLIGVIVMALTHVLVKYTSINRIIPKI